MTMANKWQALACGVIASTILTGCAANRYEPMIDTKDADMSNYRLDLKQCQAYAERVNPQQNAIIGALIGAVATAASVAIALDSGDYSSRAAGIGALAGAASGAGDAAIKQRTIIKKCLEGRGYKVLE